MRMITQPLILLVLIFSSLRAEYTREFSESDYPVAIAFLVADYKYNQEQGVKLCEVQQSSISKFTLGRYVQNGKCITSEKFVDLIDRFGVPGWHLPKTPRDESLWNLIDKSPLWNCIPSFSLLRYHINYINAMERPVSDPNRISSYHALVYGRSSQVKTVSENPSLYSGAIILDEPTFPYWIDKLKMSELFNLDPMLEKIKPIWRDYHKEENPETIYENILENFPGEYVVIKPRKCFKSNGILLVHKDDLLQIIEHICKKSSELNNSTDHAVKYWKKDRAKSFLVEEFIESDPMLTQSGRLFDTSYRTTFLLAYENHQITLHLLDTYLKYPKLALDQVGEYKDKHISDTRVKEKGIIPKEMLAEIEQQLSEPLLIMFEKMLSNKH